MEEGPNKRFLSVGQPPSHAGEDTARRVGCDDSGIVQELQVARRKQVLPDEIEIHGLARMPAEAEVEPRIGRNGLI